MNSEKFIESTFENTSKNPKREIGFYTNDPTTIHFNYTEMRMVTLAVDSIAKKSFEGYEICEFDYFDTLILIFSEETESFNIEKLTFLENIIDVSNFKVFDHLIELKPKVKKDWKDIEFMTFIKNFYGDPNLSFEENEKIFKDVKEKFANEQLAKFKDFSKTKIVLFTKAKQEQTVNEQEDWNSWR